MEVMLGDSRKAEQCVAENGRFRDASCEQELLTTKKPRQREEIRLIKKGSNQSCSASKTGGFAPFGSHEESHQISGEGERKHLDVVLIGKNDAIDGWDRRCCDCSVTRSLGPTTELQLSFGPQTLPPRDSPAHILALPLSYAVACAWTARSLLLVKRIYPNQM